jgi:hypothetical protein
MEGSPLEKKIAPYFRLTRGENLGMSLKGDLSRYPYLSLSL